MVLANVMGLICIVLFCMGFFCVCVCIHILCFPLDCVLCYDFLLSLVI